MSAARRVLNLVAQRRPLSLKVGRPDLYFEKLTPHRWKNPGRAEAGIRGSTSPPTFRNYKQQRRLAFPNSSL